MLNRRTLAAALLGSFIAVAGSVGRADDSAEGWVTIFDGKSFEGWKASENKDAWSIEDGQIVCFGPRSHLYYVGADEPFVNFEFKADVMTRPGANSGIYFHTRYQETGWPKYGHESQVNITHTDPIKSGSIYGIVKVSDPPAKDNEFYTQHIIVQGQRVIVKINGETVVDYTEPKDKEPFSAEFERRLGKGTFALQAHDPQSKVYFKNIRVKRLP
jgi:hypothetical protein